MILTYCAGYLLQRVVSSVKISRLKRTDPSSVWVLTQQLIFNILGSDPNVTIQKQWVQTQRLEKLDSGFRPRAMVSFWLTTLQNAAFISERSRNSKQLKKYDPLYFSFQGGSYFFNYFEFPLLSEIKAVISESLQYFANSSFKL